MSDEFEENERRIAEEARQERHHEVLCLVLKELVPTALLMGDSDIERQVVVAAARRVADLAYPPPKQEPSE